MERVPGVEHEPATGGEAAGGVGYWEATGDEPALRWTHRKDLPTFSSIYEGRKLETPVGRRWLAAGVATVVAGPFAILGALLGAGGSIGLGVLLLAVTIGPLVEEVLKASGALYLAEQRPWLVPAGWVLPVVAVAAGLVFAAIENVVYLNVYIADPTPEIIRWRWMAGPLLHGTASLIAGLGVRKMWTITDQQLKPPRIRYAAPFLITAVVVHALYNLTVTLLEMTDVVF